MRKGYLPRNHPKQRRDYVDFDYMDSLNEEELSYLSRFTDEYYGAAFEKNRIYVKFAELDPHLQEIVVNNKREGEYVSVSQNRNGDRKIDLRKIRKITNYYKNEKGEFTSNNYYRFSIHCINDPHDRAVINAMHKSSRADIFGICNKQDVESGSFSDDDVDRDSALDILLEKNGDYEPSVEDRLIAKEERTAERYMFGFSMREF